MTSCLSPFSPTRSLLDLPLPTGVKLVPVSQTSLSLSWDPVVGPGSGPSKEDWTYQVICAQHSDTGNFKTYLLPANSTSQQVMDLRPKHKYECRVRMMTVSVGQRSTPVSAWTLSNGKTEQKQGGHRVSCNSSSNFNLLSTIVWPNYKIPYVVPYPERGHVS